MFISSASAGVPCDLHVPPELTSNRAYFKWIKRCEKAGHLLHGGDRDDWLQAENELRDLLRKLTPTAFMKRFQQT